MSEITVGEVKLKNFLGIRTASMNFSNRGLVLVEGENGIGKTSLMVESLLYGFFGVSERFGVRRDKMVNRFVGGDCHVHLPFTIDNEIDVVVDTYRKHRKFKDPIHNLMVGGDEVFLFVNGEDKRGNSNDQTWDKIEKLIDMDYTAVTSAVVFGQTISQYFSALSDSSQKEIVERLLGITWISQAYEISKQDTADCQSKIYYLDSAISSYNSSIEEKEADIEKFKTKFFEFETGKEQKIKNLKLGLEKLVDYSNLENEVKQAKDKFLERNKAYLEAVSDIKDQEKEIAVCNSEIKFKNTNISECTANLKNLDDIEVGSTCDKCGSLINIESIEKYKVNLELDKQNFSTEMAGLKLKLENLNERLKNLNERKTEIFPEVQKFSDSVESLDRKLKVVVVQNARVEESNAAITKQIKEIKNSKNIYQEFIDKLNKEIAELIVLRSKSISDLGTLRGEEKYHKFWEDGYSNRGLKSFIIESVTPRMNEYAKIYSSEMGGKYDISFVSQRQVKKELREKFNVEVLNKFGSDDYDGNSNGERRAIDAIVMFVLGDLASSRNSKKFSLLILDDVFEKLSARVCDSIIGVLRKMVSNDTGGLPSRKSIFVLSHLDYFREKFENRMIMEEINGEKILREI